MYSIKKINYQVAADVWEGSPNSSIFNNPNFLKNFKNIVFFGVYKGGVEYLYLFAHANKLVKLH